MQQAIDSIMRCRCLRPRLNSLSPVGRASGDIIQLELNPRTGSEQAGYRPAIIISPLAHNRISKIVLVCPITSRKKGWPFEVELPAQMQTYGVVLVDQIRSVDCSARKAVFVEIAPPGLIDEVLARLDPLLTTQS